MDIDLRGCISGDKMAWDDFVDRNSGIIFASVRRTMGGGSSGKADDVSDAVQEVFVRLIKDDCRLLRSFDPSRASLSTWLTIVARSVTIDQLRKRRGATVPLGNVDPPASRKGPREPDPLPLHLLTARQRVVLHMLFDEDMTVAEAARTIGVDEQTIRSTKHKALSRLRSHLAAKGEGVGGCSSEVGPEEPTS